LELPSIRVVLTFAHMIVTVINISLVEHEKKWHHYIIHGRYLPCAKPPFRIIPKRFRTADRWTTRN
jgi:hypothetical protein